MIRNRLLMPNQFHDDLFAVYFTAPVAAARVDPSGRKLQDGHGPTLATFTFSADTNWNLFDIEVGVPGFDAGEPVDTTTQFNDTWRTMFMRTLFTLTEFTVTGAYDPQFLTEVLAQKGVNGTGTINFPDGSTYAFFCGIRQLEFDAMVEGTMPRATLTIVPTNTDPSTGAEEGPVLTSVSGT
jgi:hypothetical protein